MNFKSINFSSIRRMALYLAVALVGVFIWNAWDKEHPNKPIQSNEMSSSISAPSVSAPTHFVPPSYSATPNRPGNIPTHAAMLEQQNAVLNQQDFIQVKTDVLDVNIDPQGGQLVDAKLLKYDESLDEPRLPMPILNSDPNSLYLAQSGLKEDNASQAEAIRYHADQRQYVLAEGEKNVTVKLVGSTASGLQVIKTFIFQPNKYNVQVNYELHNTGSHPWVGNIYQQIVRKDVPPKGSQHSRSYNGAAISSQEKPYEKLSFKKLSDVQINQNIQGGWVAMQQPYFLTAWIPASDQSSHYYSSVTDNIYTLGYVNPQLNIAPGAVATQSSVFYVGPELPGDLKGLAKGLDLTIDYGWLWIFSKAIFWVMDHVHSIVKNWGWSIIITTLIIKLLFYKLSEKSYLSMAKMRDIQPRLQALKDRYGDDKQALSRATMDFYKKEKINPLGGCLPTVIQIPVFIALYYVLIESVQLRQAPFIFWIKDLSVHDFFYVLPILMGLSMFVQQRLSPPPPDPTQAKMMMLLPVVFTVFFLSFPAGLVLYWLVNNCASIFQQWYVMKTYKNKKQKTVKKKKG